MKVEFRDSFAKDLKGIREKSVLTRAKEIIETLAAVDYRVGLTLHHDTVIFVRILDRKDIYKYFP